MPPQLDELLPAGLEVSEESVFGISQKILVVLWRPLSSIHTGFQGIRGKLKKNTGVNKALRFLRHILMSYISGVLAGLFVGAVEAYQ